MKSPSRTDPQCPVRTPAAAELTATENASSVLRVNELFVSIQGEGMAAGRLCVFVRLAGCNLRCRYCDSPYAWEDSDGETMALAEVVSYAKQSGVRLVEVTGGEPLLQPAVYPLMTALVAQGFEVLLETAGHEDAANVPPEVVRIIDVKMPGSGMAHGAYLTNLKALRATDQIKFVLTDRADYEAAREILERYPIVDSVGAVFFSPAHGLLAPSDLAEWTIADRLPVRLHLQMHKYIWDPARRGV